MDGDDSLQIDQTEKAADRLPAESWQDQDVNNCISLAKSSPISILKKNGLLQSLAAGVSTKEPEDLNQDLKRAQEEWDAVESIQPGSTPQNRADVFIGQLPSISFNEALQHFQTADLSAHMKNIQVTASRTGLFAITRLLFGPPRLHRDLQEERNLVFAIAQCSFDNNERVHTRVLQTVYKKLTGSRFDCSRYGSHWEEVGFQGVDPATDLRGTGFLGLMQVLYLIMNPQTLPLAHSIYKLSQHQSQNFPFCAMSINITRITIQTLREECLNKECNRRKQVVGVVNDLYVAAFLHLYHIWKTQNKTISDSGLVLKEVEDVCKKNSKLILKRLESYLNKEHSVLDATLEDMSSLHPSSAVTGQSLKLDLPSGVKEANFTGVCELAIEMEGETRLI